MKTHVGSIKKTGKDIIIMGDFNYSYEFDRLIIQTNMFTEKNKSTNARP